MLKRNYLSSFFYLGVMGWIAAGCLQQPSYPADKLKDALTEICKKEYGIDGVDVKVVGETIGVFLPLKQLFAADFKESAITGKIRNMETLFEPSPDALEKVEDVLFSISRVILSTDKPLKFYILQATDVEKTGLQLVLTGYVDDIKRVRYWDISRNEYRKRLIHELRLNRAVKWHQPVRLFYQDLETLTADQIRLKYFKDILLTEDLQALFINLLRSDEAHPSKTKWDILNIRSAPVNKNEILVYTKVRPLNRETNEALLPKDLEYLFMIQIVDDNMRLMRIIPFQFSDNKGELKNIPFPPELRIGEGMDKWEEEFPVSDIQLGPFLADQISRRVQAMIAADERIQNTFRQIKIQFEYHEDDGGGKPYFSLNLGALLRDFNNYSGGSPIFHEDMIYLLTLASREFVDVLRGYSFGNFEYLTLNVEQEPTPWVFGRSDLELFRKNKLNLQGLLTLPRM